MTTPLTPPAFQLSTLVEDVRYGLRLIARTPGVKAIVLVTLALGIGASTQSS
jgi:hypothetical protein